MKLDLKELKGKTSKRELARLLGRTGNAIQNWHTVAMGLEEYVQDFRVLDGNPVVKSPLTPYQVFVLVTIGAIIKDERLSCPELYHYLKNNTPEYCTPLSREAYDSVRYEQIAEEPEYTTVEVSPYV